MKSITILGTSSHAGKSWVATALCAWLRSQGLRVAPFKAQNMSNNAYATLEGGEIGVAQAVQAEACGLRPVAEMNPILLKPTGDARSQIVRMGRAGELLSAQSHYEMIEESWTIARSALDGWRGRCDALVIEGAGSPVELNLMHRDIANLRPCHHVNGKWILVADIERGGCFAQVAGTWQLLPDDAKARGLGLVVNKFRGDPALFADAREHFERLLPLPYLGLLPFAESLRIDDEDSLAAATEGADRALPHLAWIKYPRVSNSQDQLPWRDDLGVQSLWTDDPRDLDNAAAVVLPGSKDTLADLAWLRARGLDAAVARAASRGTPIVGICGGFQMLGRRLSDPASGVAADGLCLLPVDTVFRAEKRVTRRQCLHEDDRWETFEIHTGETTPEPEDDAALLRVLGDDGRPRPEGFVRGAVWGTYQHGLFESPSLRRRLARAAGLANHRPAEVSWKQRRAETYSAMARALEDHLDLNPIREYVLA